MEKIKKLLAGALMVSMLLIFSATNVSAQTFLNGDDSIDALETAYPLLRAEYDSFNPNSSTYQDDVDALFRKRRGMHGLLERITNGATSAEVAQFLKDQIIAQSANHSQISSTMYDNGNYGSAEMTTVRQALLALITL